MPVVHIRKLAVENEEEKWRTAQMKTARPSMVSGLNGAIKMMSTFTRNNLFSELNKDMYI